MAFDKKFMKTAITLFILFSSFIGLQAKDVKVSPVTMEVVAGKTRMMVTGDAQTLAKSLRLMIQIHGFDKIVTKFTANITKGNTELKLQHCGYKGEIVNGYYRFIQANINEAVTANKSLDDAIVELINTDGLGLHIKEIK